MYAANLQLSNYRNYETAEIDLGPGITLFIGPNGQGKTNLVEALNFFAILGSHRTSEQPSLIKQYADHAIIRATLKHQNRTVLLETMLSSLTTNKAQINKAAAKMKDFPRHISTVLFSPEDLMLIKGEPNYRRKFLDEYNIMQSPKYAGAVSDYERILKQRNSLLKSASLHSSKIDTGTLDIWDEKLALTGAEIYMARQRFLQDLQPLTVSAYQAIAGNESILTLEYESSVLGDGTTVLSDKRDYERAFLHQLQMSRKKEIDRGMTLCGPHRDDVSFLLNGLTAKAHASHGETWSYALAVKLATAELLKRDSLVGDPILILDDVFAELDTTRRKRLAAAISPFEQTLITAAVAEDIPTDITGTMFYVKHGEVTAGASPQ